MSEPLKKKIRCTRNDGVAHHKPPSRKWFVEKRIYLPSWPLALVLLGGLASGLLVFMEGIVPYLAQNNLLKSGGKDHLLVVEGWVPDYVIDETVKVYRSGNYGAVAVTGGPTTGMTYLLKVETYAEYGAQRLVEKGIPASVLIIAPAYSVDRRRTQRMALDLRRELIERDSLPKAINLITADVHARRSRLIYQRVFGSDLKIGVVGIAPDDFDPDCWWNSSTGIKKVIMECLSLIYDGLSPTGRS